MSFRHIVISLSVAVAALVVPVAASAANTALVFSHVTTEVHGTETTEVGGLFAARGGHVTALTDNPADAEPAFSPDGATIAFARGGDLFTIRPDGTGERQLTSGPEVDSRPLFSRNGRTLVFQRSATAGAARDLYTVGSRGGAAHGLVISPQDEHEATLSPNGRSVAFVRSEAVAGGSRDAIFSTRLSGGGLTRLSRGSEDAFAPHYFAAGIVFDRGESSEGPSGFSDIYAMAANGAKPHRLVGGASSVYLRDVSADGKTMLFSRYQSLCEKAILGGKPHKISSLPVGVETQALYSPDGRQVALRVEDYSHEPDSDQRLATLDRRRGFEIAGLASAVSTAEHPEEIGDVFAWQPNARSAY
jgi:dipeptidyl aminopeptidase/acylaminoacyl peptidase